MNKTIHKTAKPSHYDQQAESYDALNENDSAIINTTIQKILKKYNVKTVLDLACGTGSQVFWLAEHGFVVIGADINNKMLAIAKNKAKQKKLKIKFIKGDMRTLEVGKFDAVITIFNAIGHLTRSDFQKAIKNVRNNLNDDGLYLFDINNLDYLLKDDNITKLTIDWIAVENNTQFRKLQYSTINPDGILAAYTKSFIQKDLQQPKIFKTKQTLQVYNAKQLKELLKRMGLTY